jgi:hypothetical protein
MRLNLIKIILITGISLILLLTSQASLTATLQLNVRGVKGRVKENVLSMLKAHSSLLQDEASIKQFYQEAPQLNIDREIFILTIVC